MSENRSIASVETAPTVPGKFRLIPRIESPQSLQVRVCCS